MDHLHYEFDAVPGDVIEVSIDRAANVQLLDPENYENYKARRPFDYYGGYATTSPARLEVPEAGRWHVVIDLGGGPGRVRAVACLLSRAAIGAAGQ